MASEIIKVPDLGGADSVEIIEINVKAGDQVAPEDPLMVLESDKASMDLPAPRGGQVKKVLVKVGDSVSEGDDIVELEAEEGTEEAEQETASEGPGEEEAGSAPAPEKPAGEAPRQPSAPAAEDSAKTTGDGEDRPLTLPDLGTEDEVEVIEISVAAGDEVAEGDTLVVLESDKATMDVPSPHGGEILSLTVKEGDKVKSGDSIGRIRAEAGGDAKGAPTAAAGETTDQPESASKPDSKDESPEAEESAAAGEAVSRTVELPDLGTEDEVEVIEISVANGDTVGEGDTLMVLESDKATMDVPSPFAGKVTDISVKEGDKVKSGSAVGSIETEAGPSPRPNHEPQAAGQAQPAAESASREPASPSPKAAPADDGAAEGRLSEPEAPATEVYAGPAVRQMARELGVDLRNVEGTGKKGRVQREDVNAYVKRALKTVGAAPAPAAAAGGGIAAVPDIDFSKFGPVEDVPLSKVARLTASNMARNWLNAPMVTQFDDADITELEAFRKELKAEGEKRDIKMTPIPFLLKACAKALAENPVINRSWHSSGGKVIQKHYYHIGMAVDTPRGLVVPVIRDVDKKGLWELAEEAGVMAAKARDGKLSAADMQGGCFSISSLGAIGGRGFTPIVNSPEAGILGISKASIQPVWNGAEFEPRQMLPLGFTYDHRVVNGADAGRFMTYLVALLGDIRRLLL